MPFRSMRLRMPWGPVRISLTKLSRATHTIGDTSSPLKGFTTLRVAASRGSVGVKAMVQGIDLPSISGYHDMTMRTIMSKHATDSTGLSTAETAPAVFESRSASSKMSSAGDVAAWAGLVSSAGSSSKGALPESCCSCRGWLPPCWCCWPLCAALHHLRRCRAASVVSKRFLLLTVPLAAEKGVLTSNLTVVACIFVPALQQLRELKDSITMRNARRLMPPCACC